MIQQTVLDNKYIGERGKIPTERQVMFLALPLKELMYGGAAGGGKSVALMMAALQFVNMPGYRALLLRRTYEDLKLPGSLMSVADEFLKETDARWFGQDKRWVFPNGSIIQFGYLDTENDKTRYKSASFHFIGFDELTEFTESQYRYLFSRLRRPKSQMHIPLRMRSATNPGGIGHKWVKNRFLAPATVKIGITRLCPGVDRAFVPSKSGDNPYLDQTEYNENLRELDPLTREQLKEGNWDIEPSGNLFRRSWFDFVDHVPPNCRSIRFWDFAATAENEGNDDPDYTAGAKLSVDPVSKAIFIEDLRVIRGTPQQVETLVKDTARLDGVGVPIRIEQEGGASGKSLVHHFTRMMNQYDCRGVRPTTDKVTRAAPFSAACERRDVKIVRRQWVNDFLDELCAFPLSAHDDQVDAVVGAYNCLTERRPLDAKALSEAFNY